ncbi:MAG TPA: c-type cytochrome [Nitrospira sp.]|nr:c-type cytochrome [Nitrospira sp.]
MNTLRITAVLLGLLSAVTAPRVLDAQESGAGAGKAPKATVQKVAQKGEPQLKVTIEEAIQAAVAHKPGRVHELEVVHKQGKLVWEVEVITPEGGHFLVGVDGTTGAVTHTQERSLQKLAGDPTNGKVVFEKHCMNCHGSDGKGTGPMGPLLIPPATAFSAESSRSKSDAELLHTIQEGWPGTAMRSYKRWLTKQEMRGALAYVRVLSRGPEQ